jgi:hypothetical protein
MPMDLLSARDDVTDHHLRRADDTSGTTTAAVVSAIVMAAQQLSRQSRNGRASRDSRVVAAAMGQLMDTLAEALAHDAGSVPQPVAEAALRLSKRINQTPRPRDSVVGSLDDMNDATDSHESTSPFYRVDEARTHGMTAGT